MDSEYFLHRLEDPAKIVSPYPSFYEGPRFDDLRKSVPADANKEIRQTNVRKEAYDADCTLWVGNIDLRITETMMFELFSQVGDIRDIRFPKIAQDRKDGERTTSFCFVNFMVPDSVPKAMDVMQGTVLFGRRLFLKCRPESIHAIKKPEAKVQDSKISPGGRRRVVIVKSRVDRRYTDEDEAFKDYSSRGSARNQENLDSRMSKTDREMETRSDSGLQRKRYGESNSHNSRRPIRGRRVTVFNHGMDSEYEADGWKRSVVCQSSSGSVLPVVRIKSSEEPKVSSVVTLPTKPERESRKRNETVVSSTSNETSVSSTVMAVRRKTPERKKSSDTVDKSNAGEKSSSFPDKTKETASASDEQACSPLKIQAISSVRSNSTSSSATAPKQACSSQVDSQTNAPSRYSRQDTTRAIPYNRNGAPQSNFSRHRWVNSHARPPVPLPHYNTHHRPPAPTSYFNGHQYDVANGNYWNCNYDYNNGCYAPPTPTPRYAYVRPNYFSEHFGTQFYNVEPNRQEYQTESQHSIHDPYDPINYFASSYSYPADSRDDTSKISHGDDFGSSKNSFNRYQENKFSRIERSRSSSRSSYRGGVRQRSRSTSRESGRARYASRSRLGRPRWHSRSSRMSSCSPRKRRSRTRTPSRTRSPTPPTTRTSTPSAHGSSSRKLSPISKGAASDSSPDTRSRISTVGSSPRSVSSKTKEYDQGRTKLNSNRDVSSKAVEEPPDSESQSNEISVSLEEQLLNSEEEYDPSEPGF